VLRGRALLGALALLLLLRGPALLSMAWGNAGVLALWDSLAAQADFLPGTYPVHGVLDQTPATVRAMRSLRHAAALDGGNLSVQWALGRAALAVGDVGNAVDALGPLARKVRGNPLLSCDALIAFSYSGQPGEVIALYESAPPREHTRIVSDALALAYLDLVTVREGEETTTARGSREQGRQAEARQWLEQAQRMRPSDLYVNYRLWKRAMQSSNLTDAAVYSETLTYFRLEAVDPTDGRLLDYATKAIQALLEDGLWDREKALRVIFFLVWKHAEAAGVERLLEWLVEHHPNDPDWPFYLAELYHRRGDLEQADLMYRQVLVMDPAYTQTYLRLGMVAEERCKTREAGCKELEEAVEWYEQYHDQAPDDYLGLKKLADVYGVLMLPGAAVWQEALERKTDAHLVAAELLGVPVESVRLGPNLVENGEFETWEGVSPVGWQLGTYLGRDMDSGLYVMGEDTLVADGKAARIVALWGGLMSDGTMMYAEYTGQSFPATSTKYLVSVYYSSQNFIEGGGLAFLGDYAHSDGLALVYQSLPYSNGQWRVSDILVDGPSAPVSVVPLVRNWGVGSLWLQAFAVSSVGYVKDFRR